VSTETVVAPSPPRGVSLVVETLARIVDEEDQGVVVEGGDHGVEVEEEDHGVDVDKVGEAEE